MGESGNYGMLDTPDDVIRRIRSVGESSRRSSGVCHVSPELFTDEVKRDIREAANKAMVSLEIDDTPDGTIRIRFETIHGM